MTNLARKGGIAASIILIILGVGAMVAGVAGREKVQSDLAREQIVGTPDSTIPGQKVDTGSEAKAFAAVMRKHTLEATGGQTYAQMGRFPDERRAGRGDGPQERPAGREPGAQHLDLLDGVPDRAQHGLLRRERGDVRDCRRWRAAARRDRVPRPDAAAAQARSRRGARGARRHDGRDRELSVRADQEESTCA
jgi:hypothetical protein